MLLPRKSVLRSDRPGCPVPSLRSTRPDYTAGPRARKPASGFCHSSYEMMWTFVSIGIIAKSSFESGIRMRMHP